MIKKTFYALAMLSAFCVFGSGAVAGTFKHITIDGSFGDWTGVPVVDTEVDLTNSVVSFKDLSIANDNDYLYIRFSLYRAASPFTSKQNIFIDADDNAAIGYGANGIGSEMLIQSGAAYRETNGTFNAGAITGLDWEAAPAVAATEFEVRISRSAVYAANGASVFVTNPIALVLETGETSGNQWLPSPAGGFTYTFATEPAELTNNLTLVDLENTPWQVNASGTDLGTNWLDQAYDDSQSPWATGPGLFGYTASPGSYPAIQTPLTSGPTTYYFRTHFNWNYETANIALVASNYISDGAVYYVNGFEARRIRMPAGAVAYGTAATGTNSPQGGVTVLGFSPGNLQIGDNILEVETHQAPGSSADMVFGLSLTAAAQYAPMIVDNSLPADQSVVAGQTVTFTSDVLGSSLSYQWVKDGDAITNATNASFTIPLVLGTDAGDYALTVSNAEGTNITRAAALTVVSTPVSITDTTQPADQYIVQGRPATFSVAATGSAPILFQWYNGAGLIPDATNDTYSISNASLTDAGGYYVAVSNPASSTNSRTAVLTVLRDTIAAAVTNVTAGGSEIVLQFSEPVDATTAGVASNYALSGGVSVTSAAITGANQITLTTGAPLTIGTNYSLAINGVNDLFANATHSSISLSPKIIIDGNFDDWSGMTPVYSGPSGQDGAADFQNIYVYDDADNYYFRVMLYHDIPPANGYFPAYVNMFFNTDNDPSTGYSALGSEMLIQSGFGYQEKNGGFNEGSLSATLNFLSAPAAPGDDFEFSFSKNVLNPTDGTPVFPTTNDVITFFWQGQTPGFVALNTASADGSVITYTNATPVVVAALPLGQLTIQTVPGGKSALIWDTAATLQSSSSPSGGSWADVVATSPYIIPSSGGSQFFRLKR
jgi:hypothetical protein